MSESGVGYLDVILDISILCYSFRFKMQWLAVIVNAIVKFVTNQCLLIKQLSVTSNSYICSGHARIGTDAKEHKVFASES